MIDIGIRPAWQRAALLLAAALVLQTTLLHLLAFRSAVPSATLAVVVWYALSCGRGYGALFGALAGALEDALSFGTGGSWTIATAAAGFLAGSARGAFFTDSIAPAALVMFVATLVRAFVFWSAMALGGYPSGLASPHAHAAVWQGALNAALYVAAVLATRWFDAWKQR